MPRQYVAAADFLLHPLAAGLNAAALESTGALDRALARGSARADSFCRRKLGLPGTTFLASSAAAGVTSLSLAGTLGLDPGPDMLLQIGSGATQETVRLGTVAVAAGASSPFPGMATLYSGQALTYGHSQGEPVAALYYEQQNPLGSSTNKVDHYWDMTQAGQIARAHAPTPLADENVRVVFVRNMPIVSLQAVQIAYPWANDLDTASVSDVLVDNDEGWVRFVLGTFVPPDSVVHLTYTGGYATVPDDVQEAVLYYTAASLVFGVNFLGAASVRSADASVTYLAAHAGNPAPSGSPYVQEAERLLQPYRVVALS